MTVAISPLKLRDPKYSCDMSRLAYILAAEEYDDPRIDATPYCHRDACLLSETLTQALDYHADQVVVRLLKPQDNFPPSKIIEELEQLLGRSNTEDTVLFYFAGHGHILGDEAFLLVPESDLDNLTQSGLSVAAIDSILRKADRFCIRILDACHSGLEPRSRDGAPRLGAGFLERISYDVPRGWITLAACDFDEKAYWDDSVRHGAYTKAMCDAIVEFREGEPVDVLALQSRILDLMTEWTVSRGNKQTPTLLGTVPGRQILGVRAVKPAVAHIPSQEPPLSVRLEAVRGLAVPGESEMKRLAERVTASLTESAGKIHTYGATLSAPIVATADSMDMSLRNAVINDIQKKQLEVQFPCRTWSREVKRRPYDYMNMFAPKEYETEYAFEPSGFPTFFIAVNLATMSPIPSAQVGVVALPLQTSIFICTFTSIGPTAIVDSGKRGLRLLQYKLLMPQNIEVWDAQSLITPAIDKLNMRLEAAVSEIVSYMEREKSLASAV